MKKLLPVCIAFLLLLSACADSGSAPAGTSRPDGAPPARAAPDTAAPAAWQMFWFGNEAPGPDGCYIVRQRPEGGSNILYADYATGQLIYLCNRPECAHADDTCAGYRKGLINLCFDGSRLYVLNMSGTGEGMPFWEVCDKNGENAKTILTFGEGLSVMSQFATDGSSLYTFEMVPGSMTNETPDGTKHLVRYGLDGGAPTKVLEKEYANAEILAGHGEEIFLRVYARTEDGTDYLPEQNILAVHRGTGAERAVASLQTYYLAAGPDGFAYGLRMEDGVIDVVEFATGSVRAIPFDKSAIQLYTFVPDVTGMLPEEAAAAQARRHDMFALQGIYDGKMFLSCTEALVNDDYQMALYAIDLITGAITRVGLTMGFEAKRGNSVIICGETPNDFLVLRDYISAPYTAGAPEGEAYEYPHTTYQYALIAKEDFYTSIPNYRDFVLS